MKTAETVTAERKLDKFFFYPKAKNLLSIIAKGIQDGVEKLRWFGSFESHVFEAMDWLVMERAKQIDGEIHLQYLYNAVKEVAKIYEMAEFIFRMKAEKLIHADATSEERLVAVGVLDEDYKDADPDPYETAGGYRSWVATKGTIVRYYLNADLTFTAKFDSNCVVDHYNNNFFGVSTGNGTTKYELGERVETRSVTLGRVAFDKGWSKTEFKATPKKIDLPKLKRLASELVPEFAFLQK